MIRVVIVDDHPALRTVLESEPGIVYAGESSGADENLWPVLNTARPDLVLMDYDLPHGDGLQLCYRIRSQTPARRRAAARATLGDGADRAGGGTDAAGGAARRPPRRAANPQRAAARGSRGERRLSGVSRRTVELRFCA